MQPSELISPQDLEQAVFDLTCEVLETMFFLFPEAEPGSPGQSSEPVVSAIFRFHGQPSGALLISMSEPAARTAAANFLALDESETLSTHVNEVVCEMANMIGGSLLGRLESGTPLQPYPPEAVSADFFGEVEPAVRHWFQIENGVLAVSVYWENR